MNNKLNVPHDLESPNLRQAVSIVVPTFREAVNIPPFSERIHAAPSQEPEGNRGASDHEVYPHLTVP